VTGELPAVIQILPESRMRRLARGAARGQKKSPMPCPLYVQSPGSPPRCAAVCAAVIPTLHQRERHCTSDEGYRSCRTLQRTAQLGRLIAEDEYDDLWLEPALAPLPPPTHAPGQLYR
jgi:hypothetical protein